MTFTDARGGSDRATWSLHGDGLAQTEDREQERPELPDGAVEDVVLHDASGRHGGIWRSS